MTGREPAGKKRLNCRFLPPFFHVELTRPLGQNGKSDQRIADPDNAAPSDDK